MDTDTSEMLASTCEGLFAELGGGKGLAFETIWPQLVEQGFTNLMVPEDQGGFGGGWSELFLVQRLAGYHALPAPVGEAALAAHLLAGQDAPGGDGLVTLAARTTGELHARSFTGTLSGVPWGRHASSVVASLDGQLFVVAAAGAEIATHDNMAGEPRDTLTLSEAQALRLDRSEDLFALGAMLRVPQIAGALDRAFELSIEYANTRVQFGKPLSKFQAVQQSLATFAEAAAATNCAAGAVSLARNSGDALFEIASAKLRANMAVHLGADAAHQVHGAIGFTQDYPLHHSTRRLQSWRAEFGNDRFWSERIGRMVTSWQRPLWHGLTGLTEGAGKDAIPESGWTPVASTHM